MGFADTIRGGIATLDSLTQGDLQAIVTHKMWIGQDGAGLDQFTSPVSRNAFVDKSRKPMYTKSGKLIITLATITIVEHIPDTTPNPGQQRTNPVDPRDIFILDDGSTAPIVKTGGFEDAGVQSPFYNEIVLGNV